MSDEDLVKRLRNTTIAIQPIFPALRHEAADAIERLSRELEAAQRECKRLCKSRNHWGQKYNKCLAKLRAAVFSDADYVAAVDEKAAEAVARAEAAERKVEKLRDLMQTLIDNEPYEPISDAGHTVIDLWRHEARAALAEPEKGDE